MDLLKKRLEEKINSWRPRTHRLFHEYGDVVIDKATIKQALGGIRGMKSLVTDISRLYPNEGIR